MCMTPQRYLYYFGFSLARKVINPMDLNIKRKLRQMKGNDIYECVKFGAASLNLRCDCRALAERLYLLLF